MSDEEIVKWCSGMLRKGTQPWAVLATIHGMKHGRLDRWGGLGLAALQRKIEAEL